MSEKWLLQRTSKKSVVRALYSAIKDIPLRVCIYDMGLQKQNGRLSGKDEAEEYEHYCRELLGDDTYLKEMCGQYPEMRCLLLVRMKHALRNLDELLQYLKNRLSES